MNSAKIAISGFAAGATLMYFADPDRGKRRRAIARDKGVKNWNDLSALVDKGRRDLSNRISGSLAEGKALLTNCETDDVVLVQRVRSNMGRVVSHPHAMEVTSTNGRIVLRGDILEDEVDVLLRTVKSVSGVKEVVNEAKSHRDASQVPSLQGGRPRESRSEFAQQNWTPALRLATGGVGTLVMLYSMARRGIVGLAGSLAGSAMVLRAVTNRELRDVIGAGDGARVIGFDKAIHIHAPVDEVFSFWSDYQKFPSFMTHVQEVRELGGGRTRWVAEGPGGIPVSWDAELTGYIKNKFLAWKSLPGSMVDSEGVIRFAEEPDGNTCVSVRMFYKPPAGVLGHYIAALFGADPKTEMDEDMARMKSLIELGKTHAHGSLVTREKVKSAASAVYSS